MTSPKSISDWMRDVHALARSKGWWDGHVTLNGVFQLSADEQLSKLMLVTTEIAEAAEEVRKPGFLARRSYTEGDGKPCGFGIELADAVIRIFDLAEAMGVDLKKCIAEKHAFNQTRSVRHGGKRA